jgi:hypothetical protein
MSIRSVAISSIILLALPALASALEEIEIVTKERATELGMIVRTEAAGPDAVHVELEFPIAGELKGFTDVHLEIKTGKKVLFSSSLREDRSQPGHIIVAFYADRARLPEFTLKVGARGDALSRVGHVLPLKDFVDLEKIR